MPSPTARPPGKQHSYRQHSHPYSPSSANGTTPHHQTTTSRPEQNHRSSPAFPFSLRLPFQSNPTSASIAPSIAEGKPIPVDDSTAEHRTSALRQLNHNYPSRHRYAKSTGAQSTTYSEPVIVRSYYPPLPQNRSGTVTRHAGGVIVRAPSAVPGSVAGSTASRRRSAPLFAAKVSSAGNGVLNIMARARGRNGHAHVHPEEAKLPPVEAFTFKSFIASLDEQGNGNDISSDLDRIAEICARSRYSLSNQYEVHYGPHGSGTGFAAENQQIPESQGPTLQAVTSDDERQMRSERRRRLGGRRNSRAMGTLETIMSSSRSSEDDKSKKKSAAELAEEVRGRAATKRNSQHTSPAASTRSARDENASHAGDEEASSAATSPKKPPSSRRASSSLALIDNSKPTTSSSTAASDTNTHTTLQLPHSRSLASAALVSEPALPQPATSQLEIQTSTVTDHPAPSTARHARSKSDGHLMGDKLGARATVATGAISSVDDATATGLLSTLTGWIPWAAAASTEENGTATTGGRAEGSLRSLLKSTATDKDV